jgi:thiamine biosynthesis lipoprotein
MKSMDEPAKTNRRQFLAGRSAAQAASDLAASDLAAQRLGEAGEEEASGGSAYLIQWKRRAMACDFELYLNAGQYPQASEVAVEAFDLIEQLEAQLTVYRDTSEVSGINRRAADEAVPVEARLFALLKQAGELHRETAGAYDITAGPLTKVWGFFRREGTIPDADALNEALAKVGGDKLLLDEATGSVRFTQAGVELNLGSIGKGYALDRADELMQAAGIGDFLWHGGRSSVLARGRSALGGGLGWTVGIRDPVRSDRRLAEIDLRDRALATSGSSVQFFRHRGRRYGHILDPRTGWPAEGIFSATVVAPTAAQADALSTAFYVLGVERALAYCQSRPEIGTLLVYPSEDESKVELATAGLASDGWRLLTPASD